MNDGFEMHAEVDDNFSHPTRGGPGLKRLGATCQSAVDNPQASRKKYNSDPRCTGFPFPVFLCFSFISLARASASRPRLHTVATVRLFASHRTWEGERVQFATTACNPLMSILVPAELFIFFGLRQGWRELNEPVSFFNGNPQNLNDAWYFVWAYHLPLLLIGEQRLL